MSQMSPQASELLEKALPLSIDDRELIIDRLVESLDEAPPKKESKPLGPTRSSAASKKFNPARSK